VASRPNPSGASKQPFSGAPLPSSRISPPCRPNVQRGGPGLTYPQASQHLRGRDSELRPWSLCSSRGTKRQKKLVTMTSASVDASWLAT
jgi:hypothetical protein